MKIIDTKIYYILKSILFPISKERYIRDVPLGGSILDVGCGNNSIEITKLLNNSIVYTGIDIVNHQSNCSSFEVIISDKYLFPETIKNLNSKFDLVISSHNLEHCFEPYAVFFSMLEKLKRNGVIFISTPSYLSINYPLRDGVLNFTQDPTHFKLISMNKLKKIIPNDYEIIFFNKRYRNLFYIILGIPIEIFSIILKKVIPGFTWKFWGFEAILIIRKK